MTSRPPSGTPVPEPEREPWEQSRGALPTVFVVVLLLLGGLVANAVRADTGPDADDTAPASADVTARNAVVFVVDDMSDIPCEQADVYLPRSSPWLRERGTCYESATVATPVCCPARAQIQTGQLAHNNGVRSQIGARNLRDTDTLQHDLSGAGVRTYGTGKFLNGVTVEDFYGPDRQITGFDEFDFWNSYKYRPETFNLYDRAGVAVRPVTGLNTTATSGAFMNRFLDKVVPRERRFLLYSAFFAPHKQNSGHTPTSYPKPSARHAKAPVAPFRFLPEQDAGDKLTLFREAKRSEQYYRELHTARLRSLLDVDYEMAKVLRRLETSGALDDTVVIFTSDNGYTDKGQNNWDGKSVPYPAATNIPMLAFYPGREPGIDRRPVSLIDIAPTIYDALDVAPGHLMDGHSMLGDYRREVVYGEFYHEDNEIVEAESGAAAAFLPSWKMVKRGKQAYVEWYNRDGSIRFVEYYEDPGMTENLLAPRFAARRPTEEVLGELRGLLNYFASCAGTVEQGSPAPCT